jgi:hypothetical protein
MEEVEVPMILKLEEKGDSESATINYYCIGGDCAGCGQEFGKYPGMFLK